jgi:hypothetical protein
MFAELVSSLAKRGVNVNVTGHYNKRDMRMSYKATVATDKWAPDSWPHVEFSVLGRDLDELAEDIKQRLPLVEPIIEAIEKQRAHREAVDKANRLGKELHTACHAVEPNTDAATAKEQTVKPVTLALRRNLALDAGRLSILIQSGILTADEVRSVYGLQPTAERNK